MKYIVTKPMKSRGLAILLVAIFGPLGMFYSTIFGAIVMLIPAPLLILIGFIYGYRVHDNGITALCIFILCIYYISWYIWAVMAVNNYNRKLLLNSNIQNNSGRENEESNSNYYQQYYTSKSDTSNYVIALIIIILLLTWGINKKEVIYSFFQNQNAKLSAPLQNKLFGKYSCNSECIYSSFEFKGKSTVVISNIFAYTYVIDENYIRIKTDKSDLLLKITDQNTLTGEGFATGIYVKISK
jgi:hypothetical protein